MSDGPTNDGPTSEGGDSTRTGRWSDSVALVVGTLTRWPVPPPKQIDSLRAGAAMVLAPAVGLALGALCALVAMLLGLLGLGPYPAAVVVIGLLALASRGLHLDGLADTADGLGSGRDADGALDIMRRGDVGPIGVATMVLVLLGQVTALAQVLPVWGPWACVVLVAASRSVLPIACRTGVSPARPGGLGAAVAGTVPTPVALLAWLATAALGLLLAPIAVVAAAVALVVAAIGTAIALRRLGGITGDVLGWLIELALLGATLALACVVPV